MKTLLAENQLFIDRLNQLSPSSQAEWGKMNVAQMLAHCQLGLKSAMSEISMGKRNIFGYIFGAYAKKKIVSGEPLGKNLPTVPGFKIVDEREFEVEKQKLLDLIKKFEKTGLEGLTKQKHPFFGKMSAEDWVALQSSHLDHHFRQFGV